MLNYIIRRILISVPILLAVVTLIFVLVRSMPGGPAAAVLGDYASEEAVAALNKEMGLDLPISTQYVNFLKDLSRGDLGRSLISGTPIAPQIVRAIPYTFELSGGAILLGVILGIPLGVLTALRRNRMFDYVGRTISLVGISLPSFFFGIILILFFSVKLNLFPVVGGGDITDLADSFHHLFLPCVTLGLTMIAFITRTTRSSVLNVLREDYVRTARAKGLPERMVIYGHALGNALLPVVSFIGVYAIVLVGNSVLVEIVFSRPGLGKIMVNAIGQRDYMTVQSVMVIYAGLVFVINLLTDLSYGLIDPRIRYD